MALGLILLLYPMAFFEIQYSFQLVSANLRFFYLVQPTPDSNSYYLLVAVAKIQNFVNKRHWTSIFRYANLKIVPLIASELFDRNLSNVNPTLFLNFVIAPKHN